ncbi:hypothetical protein [Flavobacterium sp. SM2513]|uniref:hypothetical protein n=1 Tax=Flavobacterium sp. SM2513 TaxID=3424766 RepID=UPI003D7F1B00
MTTLTLKNYLVSKINSIEDDSVLVKIKTIIDQNEEVYILSDSQIRKVEKSRNQIENGNFLTQKEMDKKVEEWLNVK